MKSEPETLEELLAAFERGDYGNDSMMSLTVSILQNGGSVEHLRGIYPDRLLDFFAESLRKRRAPKELDGTEHDET